MLERNDDTADLAVDADPPLRVLLPEGMENFFEESGLMPSGPFEDRSSIRTKIRREIVVLLESSPLGLANRAFFRERRHLFLLKDLSRRGIGFLSPEQLFPLEKFIIALDDRVIQLTVVRCRRLGQQCYEVGCLASVRRSVE